MALNPTRVRRILSLSCYLSSRQRLRSTTTRSLSCLFQFPTFPSQIPDPSSSSSCNRFFHSTRFSLSSSRTFNDGEKIDPDTILFEGCDYKHWLIVMDFGNDPQQRPPPEQMVETYVQTLAKVVGSVEEAKKRMYACSTTTYTGFQAEMDEETSNKFEGMPGVVFVLPDSYIDPVNKEYGGDKYINGTIIPRPPPVQYGRARRGRQNDQRPSNQMPYQQGNRTYNQHGPVPGDGRGMPYQQGNHTYNQHGPMPGEGRGMPQRQHPPPNYGPPGQGGRSNPVSSGINYSEQGRGGYQGRGNTHVPPNQGNYNYHNTHPHKMEHHPSDQGYIPHGRVSNHQVDGFNHPQGQMKNSPGDHVGLGYPGDSGNYAPPNPARPPDGQSGTGFYQQYGARRYVQGPNASFDQGGSVGYHGSSTQPENQSFTQAPDEQNTMPAENRNYTPAAQTGMNQGRF